MKAAEEKEEEGECEMGVWCGWRNVQEDGGLQARQRRAARGAAQAGTRPTTPGKLGCLGAQQRVFFRSQVQLRRGPAWLDMTFRGMMGPSVRHL
jgi:hypothetical protein